MSLLTLLRSAGVAGNVAQLTAAVGDVSSATAVASARRTVAAWADGIAGAETTGATRRALLAQTSGIADTTAVADVVVPAPPVFTPTLYVARVGNA